MTPTPINRETLAEALEAVVAERGEDYVYPINEPGYAVSYDFMGAANGCRYMTDEEEPKPACIFGAALFRMGYRSTGNRGDFPLEGSNIGAWLDDVLPDSNYDFTLSFAARMAQSEQDQGKTWGEALQAYKNQLYLPTEN